MQCEEQISALQWEVALFSKILSNCRKRLKAPPNHSGFNVAEEARIHKVGSKPERFTHYCRRDESPENHHILKDIW